MQALYDNVARGRAQYFKENMVKTRLRFVMRIVFHRLNPVLMKSYGTLDLNISRETGRHVATVTDIYIEH